MGREDAGLGIALGKVRNLVVSGMMGAHPHSHPGFIPCSLSLSGEGLTTAKEIHCFSSQLSCSPHSPRPLTGHTLTHLSWKILASSDLCCLLVFNPGFIRLFSGNCTSAQRSSLKNLTRVLVTKARFAIFIPYSTEEKPGAGVP